MSVYTFLKEKWFNHSVWLYSDPHFSDISVNQITDEEQIKNINSCVGKKDTLIILGDVGNIECVKRLKGYKVLIMGNHDSGVSNYKKEIFSESFPKNYTYKEILENMKGKYPNHKVYLEEKEEKIIAYADNLLFDEVYKGALLIGEKIMLSHEPIYGLPWVFNIHGHDHAGENKDENHLNLCANIINFKPISFNNILKMGLLSKVQTIHRIAINKAISRKNKE